MIRSKAVLFLASTLITGTLWAAGNIIPGGFVAYEFKLVNSDLVRHLLSAHIVVPDHDSWNGVRRVSENTAFYDHQRFRLELQPRLSGHVYVFSRDSQGEAQLLYPQSGDEDNYVARNSNVSLPGDGWFRFDEEPGQEELLVLESATPLVDIEHAMEDDDSDHSDLLEQYERPAGGVLVRRMFLEHDAR